MVDPQDGWFIILKNSLKINRSLKWMITGGFPIGKLLLLTRNPMVGGNHGRSFFFGHGPLANLKLEDQYGMVDV